MRRLSFRPSPALLVAVAALVASCGGIALAAGISRTSVIRACANKTSGALRLAGRCRKAERAVAWNREGVRGPLGSAGAAGAPGVPGTPGGPGERGPQGPGAISFDTAVTGEQTLAGPVDGIVAKALCSSEKKQVGITVEAVAGKNTLQASGTNSEAATVSAVNSTGGTAIVRLSALPVDQDVIAADSTVGKMVRVDLHAEYGEPSCPVWGMVIPPG